MKTVEAEMTKALKALKKEIVFLEIGHTKAKRNRRRYIAVLAAAMGIRGRRFIQSVGKSV